MASIDCRPVYDATSGIWLEPGAMHKNSAWCSTAFNLSKFRWSLSAVTFNLDPDLFPCLLEKRPVRRFSGSMARSLQILLRLHDSR
jgi:hypothetical protein